jgi:hypothetical protein
MKKKSKHAGYSSIHQRIARLSSSNTHIAKKFLRKLDKGIYDTNKINTKK